MKQQLLADIELDVQELKCLMKSFSEEPKPMLAELVKRNVSQMQNRLELLLQGVEADLDDGFIEGAKETVERPMGEPVFIVESPRVDANLEELPAMTDSYSDEEPVDEASEAEGVCEEAPNVLETNDEDEIVNPDFHVISEDVSDINGDDEVLVSDEECVEEMYEEEEDEEECVSSTVLGERLRVVGGLRQSISLNDSFRFSRELFGGDMALMNRVLEQLSVMSSYKNALAFLASKFMLDEENEAHLDFLELLKKYFSQTA